MPARSKLQLRAAYAHQGEEWADEMIKMTKTTKGLPERKHPKKKARRLKSGKSRHARGRG